MNAYFTASIVGRRHHLGNYLKIVAALKKKGIKVQYEHITETSEEALSKKTKEERLAFQAQLEKNINSADFLVAETSFPSISVGFEIAMALSRMKPILILYNGAEPPSLLIDFKDEHVVSQKYISATIDEIITDFLTYVEGSNDTRFTFFITPEISAFLDQISRTDKIPKSVYLRRLIKHDMEKRGKTE